MKRILPNRVYGIRTADGLRAEMTAREHPELPQDGEILELYPVFSGAGGFMIGFGESVRGHVYRFDPEFASGRGNFRRCLLSYRNCRFERGVWKLGAAAEIVFNHYVAGRSFRGGAAVFTCAAVRSGEAVIERTDGGKTVELCRFAAGRPLTVKVALPDEPACCPTFVVRGLGGCDLDFAGYVYETTLSGPAENLIGATDLRIADLDRSAIK